jgi:integrase
LSPIEINDFLYAEKDQKYKTLFNLAITSGARQGELLGLKWTDIDWFNNQIHIQRTYSEGAWYKPKSKTSNTSRVSSVMQALWSPSPSTLTL